jgi:hypothetical protein
MEKCCTAGEATNYNILRRMRLARWVTNATDTHSEYEILIVFPRQQSLRERAPRLRLCVHRLCCFAPAGLVLKNVKRSASHKIMFCYVTV